MVNTMQTDILSTHLISIIVPVYNVEKYIAKCIDSIIKQTYTNLEIIIIDDGSPDHSGKISEGYQQKDNRIKVIHTKNSGVSAARNLGVDNSKGKYVVFVDGDDFLASDFIEYMLSIIKKTGAYFAMSKRCFKSLNEAQTKKDLIETYTPENAAIALLYPNIEIGCWNKMFLRDFLVENKIIFPENFFMGEGLNFIVSAAQMSNCVGVGNRKVYYYRKDNLSSATTQISVDKMINALLSIENIKRNAIIHTPSFKMALDFHEYFTTLYAWNAIFVTHKEKVYPNEYKQWFTKIRKDALHMMKANVSSFIKIKILAYGVNPRSALKLQHFFSKIKHQLKLLINN